ncbi:hypothetical protein LTR57_002657 [Friedmanniomyces endolithicus]|nr:hypothetical protein LTR57_002657 [Friedmanniomyces endolithicus]
MALARQVQHGDTKLPHSDATILALSEKRHKHSLQLINNTETEALSCCTYAKSRPLVYTAFLAFLSAHVCATNPQNHLHDRAADGILTEVIAVDRFGSMCPPSTTAETPNLAIPQQISSATTPSSGSSYFTTSVSGPPSTSTSSTSSPLPPTSRTQCTDPVCPILDHEVCVDAAGSTYGIICDSTLTGLVAFPPALKKKRGDGLHPREYTLTFMACLAVCDQMGGGCRGVSWSEQSGGGGDCLVYGGIAGVEGRNGTVAARRLATYGQGGGGGGAAYGGGGTYGAGGWAQ